MSNGKKYFGTDGIRGEVGQGVITPEFFLKLGWAAGRVFSRAGKGKIVIGKDTRISGYMFESALESGLAAAGCDSLLVGPMPTPGVAYLTRAFHADAGIVISASHNPFYDNGIKFFAADGTKLPDDIEFAIEAELDAVLQTVPSSELGKARRIEDASGRYIEFCKSTSGYLNLDGMHIVLDCAHGATYDVAPKVFRELGATVHVIGAAPDGLNINDQIGSTHPAALQKAVLEQNAQLGIAFDGDGDRLLMVDQEGQAVDGDELLFILAKHLQGKGVIRQGIVGTLMTNLGLEVALRKLDLELIRANVGDRYVMEQLNTRAWPLGGENSGHIVCKHVTTTGDGIVAALQVLCALRDSDQTLAQAKSGMRKYPQVMINVKLPQRVDVLALPAVQSAMAQAEQVLAETGRVLLRPSGTEPVVRVMVEGEDITTVKAVCKTLASAVSAAVANL
ncbi:MAG: phosphoglucosamine mutase [Reinekea forsetii]|uniref:Phosphoglucosamine mutase n=1 Tax=Reinekea forsetii TaxID=1336806 RepID=A0A2K8KL47_9GAMM|nr:MULTISPECIES: phosphoglucosamine mutase [Reinekea]ATX75647.1 phosphoglucosamine mutase GlmM [Reinekea forsetii]MDO7673259.1 phosphoglucosamine mutase [Reinekea forsetii]